jgi:hypothetical protein
LLGQTNGDAEIRECVTVVDLFGPNLGGGGTGPGNRWGGLVGNPRDRFRYRDSYSSGKMEFASGGLMGGCAGSTRFNTSNPQTIRRCMALVLIDDGAGSTEVDGFCGDIATGTSGGFTENFFDYQLADQSSTSPTATGLTTTQAQQLSTFTGAGWDIERIGNIDPEDPPVWFMPDSDGEDYPRLYWELEEPPEPGISPAAFRRATVIGSGVH